MGIFGGNSRKKRLKKAFDIPLHTTARDRAAARREAAKDRLIAIAAREKKKQAKRDEMVAKADALKEAALERKRAADAEVARKKRVAEQLRRARAEERERCTCRKPVLDSSGKCRRCHRVPAGKTRRR